MVNTIPEIMKCNLIGKLIPVSPTGPVKDLVAGMAADRGPSTTPSGQVRFASPRAQALEMHAVGEGAGSRPEVLSREFFRIIAFHHPVASGAEEVR